jgi:hypothetical protein
MTAATAKTNTPARAATRSRKARDAAALRASAVIVPAAPAVVVEAVEALVVAPAAVEPAAAAAPVVIDTKGGESPELEAARAAAEPVVVAEKPANVGEFVREIAAELLRDHPEGFSVGEINALVLAVDPSLPKPAVRHHLWRLYDRAPEQFVEVAPGVVALVQAAA